MMPKSGAVGQDFLRDPKVVAAAVLLGMISPQPALAGVTAEQALANARRLTGPPACGTADEGDEIVVCGRRVGLYRLPPTEEHGQVGDRRGRAGEVPGASPERLGGPCGLFAGERRCGRAENLQYGYGGGKDPVTVVVNVAKALLDPE